MSDQSDVPATEPDEVAQDATVQEPVSEHPWGDDFDAERAWKTIQNLRQFEKQAKEFERIQSDDDARAEWLKSQGYEFADDEAPDSDEELFEDDDPVKPLTDKLSKLEAWQQDQVAKETAAQIKSDLDAIHGDSEWTIDDKARRWIVSEASQDPKGFTRDALERAHADLIAQWEAIAAQGVERAKKPRAKAPHVPNGGKAATGTTHVSEMTTREREQHMVRRAQEMMSGQ